MTFKNEIEFAKYIKNLGGVLFRVGGAVRDEFIGIKPKDVDYVIIGIDLNQIFFEKIVGQDFPVFLVEIEGKKQEVALARQEKKNGTGYHGFNFYTDKNITIEQDLARRDLTINAMAKNVLTGEIIDPFYGKVDLERKILRHTTSAFNEDPLRVYRVARFAARWNFIIATETKAQMKLMKNQLYDLTVERVWLELEKVLNTIYPSNFFRVLFELDLLNVHFPEVQNLNVPDKHDGTALNHTLSLLNSAMNPKICFGLLVHDFGKGLTPADLLPCHYEHDANGAIPVKNFCNRLKIPNEYARFGLICAQEHMRGRKLLEMTPGKAITFVLKNKSFINDLLKIIEIDSNSHEKTFDLFKAAGFVNQILAIEKEINGNQLIEAGFKPGPEFKGLLLQRRIEALKNKVKKNFIFLQKSEKKT